MFTLIRRASRPLCLGDPALAIRDEIGVCKLKTKEVLVYEQEKSKNLLAIWGYQMSVLAKRLKEARGAAGLSQERLGILAGLDPMSASARMNQYETAKHAPNISVVRQIAAVLDLPEAYFYAEEDDSARLLVLFHRLPEDKRQAVVELAMSLAS